MPDRTRDRAKFRANHRIRQIRYQARLREKRIAAEKAAKAAHRDALDAARVARGLLPIREAKAASLTKFRDKQKKLREMVSTSWFAPWLADEEFGEYARARGWDDSTASRRKESFRVPCCVAQINMNAFVLTNYVHSAMEARLRFHEAYLVHNDILKGLETAEAIQIVFKGSTPAARELDRQTRYQAAADRWGTGDEIVTELLGRKQPQEELPAV